MLISSTDTIVDAARDVKASLRQQLRSLRGPRAPNGGSHSDPNKNWEARCRKF